MKEKTEELEQQYLRQKREMEELENELARQKNKEVAALEDLSEATHFYLKDYLEDSDSIYDSLRIIEDERENLLTHYKKNQKKLEREMEERYEQYTLQLKKTYEENE